MSRGTVTVAVTYDRADMALRGRIGAAVTHSRHDPRPATEAARAALWAKWEHEVDPDGTLTAEERRHRAEHAQRAHMLRAARASILARKKNAPNDVGHTGSPAPLGAA
jgi:hypothetical protein